MSQFVTGVIFSMPYLILLWVYFILAFVEWSGKNNPKLRGQIILLCAFIYILFFGLRGFIGWDWFNYYPYYENTPSLFQLSKSSLSFDLGFTLFTSAFKTLGFGYHTFVFINSIINVALVSVFLKRYLPHGLYTFGFIVFLVMGGMTLEVDLMRNVKSLLLFLVSIKYIEQRNPFKFFILNFIGLSFHSSAIIFIPLYFFIHKVINRKLMLAVFVAGITIFLLQIQYIKPIVFYIAGLLGKRYIYLANSYLNSQHFGQPYGITIGMLERVVSAFLIYLYYPILIKQNKANKIFINTFVCYFFLFFFFSEVKVISTRLGGLFSFSYWILWPFIILCSRIKHNIIIFVCILSIYINLKMVGLTNLKIYKYDNVLFGIKDYQERNIALKDIEKNTTK